LLVWSSGRRRGRRRRKRRGGGGGGEEEEGKGGGGAEEGGGGGGGEEKRKRGRGAGGDYGGGGGDDDDYYYDDDNCEETTMTRHCRMLCATDCRGGERNFYRYMLLFKGVRRLSTNMVVILKTNDVFNNFVVKFREFSHVQLISNMRQKTGSIFLTAACKN